MIYDISILWFWLLLALALGCWFGWREETPEPQAENWWRQGWFYTAARVWAALALLALFHIPGGRLGAWIEAAVFLYAAYVIGCLGGGAWRRRDAAKAPTPS